MAALLEQHGLGRVLLVTSALHMPRALACFRAAGVDAVPATTDTRAHEPYSGALDWIPSASFLGETDLAIKELLGFQVYRLRGWL